jgi:hypothetical protein
MDAPRRFIDAAQVNRAKLQFALETSFSAYQH